VAGQTEHGPFAGTDGTDQKQSRASSRLLLIPSSRVAQTGVGRWANSLCLRRVIERSSDFLKYDLYCVAATTAFRGATERVVDLAHSQTGVPLAIALTWESLRMLHEQTIILDP